MPVIKINSSEFYYEKYGKGYPLVFLPASLTEIRSYKKLLEILSENYTVYIIDIPRHGRTKTPAGLSVNESSDLLNKAILKLKLKKPILMGHSLGSLFAIMYSVKYNTKELVLLNPAGLKYYDKTRKFFFHWIFKTVPENFSINFKDALTLSYYGFLITCKNIFNFKIWELIKELVLTDYTYLLKKINTKITLVWGTKDKIIPIKYAKQYQQIVKCKLIKVPGNHDWPHFQPELIKRWLK